MGKSQQRRATNGNGFIHFSIRAIASAEVAHQRGHRIRSLLEHPEDLGRTHRGTPASIWQLPALRKLGKRSGFQSVAVHQCQFGIDVTKPTRLLSDIPGIAGFGTVGWA